MINGKSPAKKDCMFTGYNMFRMNMWTVILRFSTALKIKFRRAPTKKFTTKLNCMNPWLTFLTYSVSIYKLPFAF
jgi:hypothetical protein